MRGSIFSVWVLTASALGGVAILPASCGCAAGNQQKDLEFQLRRNEQERESLRQQLTSARAAVVASQKRGEGLEAELGTARAEVGHLRDRLDDLQKQDGELRAVLDQLKNREMKRPSVATSPLPAPTDEALQAFASKFKDRVWYDQGRGAVSFANDRLFDSGSDVVRADAHAALHELAGVLSVPELADYEVIVVGHTDSTPVTKPETQAQHPTNWHLSVHRAIAVKDVLVKGGLPAVRLGVMGYADNRPLGDDPAKNRRVEIFIVRKGGVEAFSPVQPVAKKK